MKVSEENYFVSSKKNPSDKIFFKRLFRGDKKRSKVILFFHDARLHSDIFTNFFKDILKESRNVEVYAFDIYGHGRSGGERMGPVEPESLLDDVSEVLKKIREVDNLPVYCVGVGFGSSVILNYLSEVERNEVKGIILLNPMLEVDLNFSRFEKFIYSDFSYGSSLRVSSKVGVNELVFKPEKKISLGQDPLCFDFYTRGFLKTMRAMGKSARKKAYFVDQPSFIIYSEKSPLYNNDIIPVFSKGLRSKRVTLKEVSGSHLFMIENDKITKMIMGWISEN